uniref:Uncharacterized protein n=1 Tax=Podarcis muralis TaxID=64176 RepID=A0A670JDZ6_PODMU
MTPWTRARQALLSSTASRSLVRLMFVASRTLSRHLVLCRPLLLGPSIFPNIRVFSRESSLLMRWPKYWSLSFRICPSSEHSGLISFRMDTFDLLAVHGTLKSLLQQHNSKASILRRSAFLMVQLSLPYITTGKTRALTIRTFVGKVTSLLFKSTTTHKVVLVAVVLLLIQLLIKRIKSWFCCCLMSEQRHSGAQEEACRIRSRTHPARHPVSHWDQPDPSGKLTRRALQPRELSLLLLLAKILESVVVSGIWKQKPHTRRYMANLKSDKAEFPRCFPPAPSSVGCNRYVQIYSASTELLASKLHFANHLRLREHKGRKETFLQPRPKCSHALKNTGKTGTVYFAGTGGQIPFREKRGGELHHLFYNSEREGRAVYLL